MAARPAARLCEEESEVRQMRLEVEKSSPHIRLQQLDAGANCAGLAHVVLHGCRLNGQVGQRSDARLQQRRLGGSAARGPGGLLGGDLLRVLQTAPDQTKQGWNGSSATQSPLNVAATSCTHTKTPSISLLTTSNFEVQSNAWGRKQEWRWQQNQLRTVSCTKASVHLKTFN